MTVSEKNSIRQDRGRLVQAIIDAGGEVVSDKKVRCPFHDDQHPSANIRVAQDGAWKFHCFTCKLELDIFDVIAKAQNKTAADVLREMSAANQPARASRPREGSDAPRVYPSIDALKLAVSGLERVHIYTHADTRAPELVILRNRNADRSKKFIQCSPCAGGFVMRAPPKPWPIYNRSRIAAAESIVIVEGETCVEALAKCGIVATTSPGGAGKASHANWQPLAGKTCYLWADFDPLDPKTGKGTGAEHMREVAELLALLDPPPRVLIIPVDVLGLPPKGDAVQFLEIYGGQTPETKRRAVGDILLLAEPVAGAASEVGNLIEDSIAGRRQAIPWPWQAIGRMTLALLPGTVTVLCGDAGATKSLLLLSALAYWHQNGIKTAVFELEEDRAHHLARALCQRDENSELTDPEWIKRNPEESRAALARHSDFLDSFGRCIDAAPDTQPSVNELAAWIRARCEAGCRIVAIDPVTAARVSETPWIDDQRFLLEAKAIVRQYGASLIVVTHPRKGKKYSGMDDIASSAAYSRFSQTVLWLERHDVAKSVTVAGPCGSFSTSIDRTIVILKSRNGRGTGRQIGFTFDPGSLQFSEQGLILKKKSHEADGDETAGMFIDPLRSVQARKLAAKLAGLFPLQVTQTQGASFTKQITGLDKHTVETAIDAHRAAFEHIDWPKLLSACGVQTNDIRPGTEQSA